MPGYARASQRVNKVMCKSYMLIESKTLAYWGNYLASHMLVHRSHYGICNDTLPVLSLVLGLTLIIIHCAMVGPIQSVDSFLMADAQK